MPRTKLCNILAGNWDIWTGSGDGLLVVDNSRPIASSPEQMAFNYDAVVEIVETD